MNKKNLVYNKKGTVSAILIFAFVGLIFFAVGLFITVSDSKKNSRCTAETDAIIVDYAQEIDAAAYTPVVSFDVNGFNYQTHNNFYSSSRKYKLGESVKIHYDPDNPFTFYINGDHSKKIFSLIFCVIGGITFIIPIIIIISSHKSKNNMTFAQQQFSSEQYNGNYQERFIPQSGCGQNYQNNYNNQSYQNGNSYSDNQQNYQGYQNSSYPNYQNNNNMH